MKQSIGSMMFMLGASLTLLRLGETDIFAWLIILFLTIGRWHIEVIKQSEVEYGY